MLPDCLEKTLDGLRKIFGLHNEDTALDDDDAERGNRDPFYANLDQLLVNTQFNELAGKLKILPVAASADAAKTDLGQFLSLHYLIPFSLSLTDSSAENSLIMAGQGQFVTDWLNDKGLRESNPDAAIQGLTTYTDQYLQDRALMVEHLMISNEEDVDFPDSQYKIAFYDYESKASFFTNEPILDIGPRDRYTFGDSADNFLAGPGSKGDDHFYGMAGSDTLVGQDGDDYLALLPRVLRSPVLVHPARHGGVNSDDYHYDCSDGREVNGRFF